MDRYLARDRANDLRTRAATLHKLAEMPDRAKAEDLRSAEEAMRKAADSIDALTKGNLPGCVCRTIHHDDYSYLDYAESCRDHGGLFRQVAELKKSYEKTEKKLKDEVRLSLVKAALTGASTLVGPADGPHTVIVKRAIAVADEAIRQITGATE